MDYETTPAQRNEDAFDTPIPPLDGDSPLLTASFTSGEDAFLYLPSEREVLLLAEEKDRGRWRQGRSESEAERAVRIEAQRQKTEEIHQHVEAGLEALSQSLAESRSDELLSLLAAMSRFHRYSWGNILLIVFQNPEATRVAGFTTWKELGRFVKAGERGLALLAPLAKRVRVEAEDERQDERPPERPDEAAETKRPTTRANSSGVRGFKVVFVFDVSQTDGKPLPELATVTGDPAHALPRLQEQVRAAGIRLDYADDLGGALGCSRGGRIEIRRGLSPAQEFSTLVHEFAHERLHPKTERAEIPKTVKETEAEAVAFVVSRAVGLDTGTASRDYIQLYRGDAATLALSLDRIQQTASHILSRLEEPQGKQATALGPQVWQPGADPKREPADPLPGGGMD